MERVSICLGFLISAANGAVFPISTIYFGAIIDIFLFPKNLKEEISAIIVAFPIIGTISFVLSFLQSVVMSFSVGELSARLKAAYFKVTF